MGSTIGNAIFTTWSPSTGLSNPNILNPVATITGPITYTLTGWGIDPANPNLIVNGDFEQGNIGFSSDYNFVINLPIVQDEMVDEGTYTVINNPTAVHSGFASCNDHTPGSGDNMMVVNGAASFQDVWCQTVNVNPNTWYNVAAWVASVHSSSPAVLQFSINGTPIGDIVNAPSTTCQWVPFNTAWNSGSSTSATICILNLNTASSGNDFAIDDISMVGLCPVEDEVNIILVDEVAPVPIIHGHYFLCEGQTGVYTVELPPGTPVLNYIWTAPPGATVVSGQGTPIAGVKWDITQIGSLCLTIETLCDENMACYQVTVEDLPELPLITGPAVLCTGETATFSTQELNPDDEYNWIIPPQLVVINGQGTNEIDVEWAAAGDVEICLEVSNECGTTENCAFISLFPAYQTLLDTILCTGTMIVINGNLYGNGNWTGTEYFTTIDGCDSIVDIIISEASSLEFTFDVIMCQGDSMFLEGAFQTEGGTYIDSFMTISGCDSLVFTNVTIAPLDTTWINSATCDPAAAGTFIEIFTGTYCDSTVITEIILLDHDTTTISLTSCFLADTGQSISVLTNQFGCDSVIITNTSFSIADTTRIFQNTCDPFEAGITIQELSNVNGCDSIIITTVAFVESDTTIVHFWSCSYADTGSTQMVLTNIAGCDSIVVNQTVYAGSDTTYLFEHSCSPADSGSVYASFVNQYGCDSTITTVTTLDPPEICFIEANFNVQQPQCYGDPALVEVDIIEGLGPFELQWIHEDLTGQITYPSKGVYSFPFDMEGETFIILSSANGLSLSDTIYIISPPPLIIDARVKNTYSGFGLPCNGDSIGEIELLLLSGGSPPLTFEWSSGATTQNISNMPSGAYHVTVTDDHGCVKTDTVLITEPQPMQYEIIANDIACFGIQNGSIIISGVQGGISPWISSLNGSPFQEIFSYQDLAEGNYELVIMDKNSCTFNESITITEPGDWSVSLAPDTSIAFGSAFNLNTQIIGQPEGMVDLLWSDGLCDNCASRTVDIMGDVTYKVTAIDENGCTREDEITVIAIFNRNIFIPNIFSPNGDGVNDHFTISSGPLVEEILEFTIYDRWGSAAYQKFNFQTNAPDASWDGNTHDKPASPGVYIYKLTVKFKDGVTQVYHGDITLVK